MIAGVFAALAYLGMNETIKSTVSEQIKKELEKRDDQIRKATQDIFVNVGKAQKDQEQISTALTESKMKLTETEAQRGYPARAEADPSAAYRAARSPRKR